MGTVFNPVINHDGKEYEKEFICVTGSFCYVAEVNIINQLYFNKILRGMMSP